MWSQPLLERPHLRLKVVVIAAGVGAQRLLAALLHAIKVQLQAKQEWEIGSAAGPVQARRGTPRPAGLSAQKMLRFRRTTWHCLRAT